MIWYYILTFFAQTIEGFAGFGSTAMALPFLSIAIGTTGAVALLSLNSMVSGGAIMATHIKQVNRKEYLKMFLIVLPFIPAGILLYSFLSPYENVLKLVLGLATVVAGARGVWYYYIKKTEPPALSKFGQYAALFAGSLVQGMFTAGGPLIVLYANEKLHDKGSFRATMTALWFSLNVISLVLRLLMLDMYTGETFITAATCLPVLAAAILLGMYLHKRIDNANFRKIVFLILLAGGASSTAFCLVGML